MGYLLTTCTQILDPRCASGQRVTIFSKSSPRMVKKLIFASVELVGDQLAIPTQNGIRLGRGCYFLQRLTP
jgi:hypothetical protein